MTTKPQDKEHTKDESQHRQQVDARIGRHLMHALGQPSNLQTVQVRHLWEAHYRVNVFVGQDAASARVANSFFLVADGEGNILTSTPAIVKQY